MPQSKIDTQTLQERFTNVERHTREMIQHLEKGFIPKTHKLTKLFRKKEREEDDIKDITVRNTVRVVLDSERYTDQLFRTIADYCSSIDKSVVKIEETT